ncbi:MAG: hypothetical protein ABSB49_13350 [Polyangia bacterium]|jgi:hypothetical protein
MDKLASQFRIAQFVMLRNMRPPCLQLFLLCQRGYQLLLDVFPLGIRGSQASDWNSEEPSGAVNLCTTDTVIANLTALAKNALDPGPNPEKNRAP